MPEDTPLRRRHFLQATLAATVLGSVPSVAAADSNDGPDYGESGYGQGGYGGANPFGEPVGRSATRPQDYDGDGTYEDFDGDGDVDTMDAVALFYQYVDQAEGSE